MRHSSTNAQRKGHQLMRRRFRGVAPALLVAGIALVAATATQARPNADPIKIGSITILTGPSAQIGVETARGAQFMVDYLNKRGGIRGQKLELVSTDDANNPQLAVQSATQLIQQDHVAAI